MSNVASHKQTTHHPVELTKTQQPCLAAQLERSPNFSSFPIQPPLLLLLLLRGCVSPGILRLCFCTKASHCASLFLFFTFPHSLFIMRVLAGATILSLAASCVASSGYLKLDLHRRATSKSRLARRQDVDAVLTQNQGLEYLVNITVGTPAQKLAVTLDTGSSDLWIPASSASLCQKGQCDFGSFDPSSSSTYQVVEEDGFNIVSSPAALFALFVITTNLLFIRPM